MQRRPRTVIADYAAQITLANAWLDEQTHPLFRDEKTGELSPIVEKRDGWARSRAALADKLPDLDALPPLRRV
jgi:hypothetical protein